MDSVQDTQFADNETVDHLGHLLRIVKLLSDEGLTSRVYEGRLAGEDQAGEIQVAVKLMKPLELVGARASFKQENRTLKDLNDWEEKANEAQKIQMHVIPRSYGPGEKDGTPYFVMEFVPGKEIPKLLNEKGGKFPESQALLACWQLFRTLDLLHTSLKKTYDDLKYVDLLWVEGENDSPGHLMLIDLGTLGEIQQSELDQFKNGGQPPLSVSSNLLLAGVYLCHMITGQMPAYSMAGLLKERAEPIIRGMVMSWGARQLLLALLHRNPEKRPVSASQVASELRILVHFWQSPLEKVLDAARTFLVKAEAGENLKPGEQSGLARKARSALDIARLRSPNDPGIVEDIKRAEKALALDDYIERGKSALQNRQPDYARKLFEEGMSWIENPGHARRWAYLARTAEQIPSQEFDPFCQPAIQMVELINAEDWRHALERFEALKPVLRSDSLEMILADIHLFQGIENAEKAHARESYREAGMAFREALLWLEKLPDADFIKREELGDLLRRAEEAESLAMTVEASRKAWAEAEVLLQIPETDWKALIEKVQQAFNLDPDINKHLDTLNRMVEQTIQKYLFSEARQLAWMGLQRDASHKAFYSAFYLSKKMLGIERALIRGDKNQFWALIRDVRANSYSKLNIVPVILHCCELAYNQAVEKKDSLELGELSRFASEMGASDIALNWQEKARELTQERETAISKLIDTHISDVTALFQFENLDTTALENILPRFTTSEFAANLRQPQYRLDELEMLVSNAEGFSAEVDYRGDEIKNLRTKLDVFRKKELMRAQAWAGRNVSEKKDRMDEIIRKREELELVKDWGRKAAESGSGDLVLKEITKKIEADEKELIRRCQVYLINWDASEEDINCLLLEFGQALNIDGWKLLKQKADEQIEMVNEILELADNAFKQGDSPTALAELRKLDLQIGKTPTEWETLKKNIVQAELFQDWQRAKQEQLEMGQYDKDLLNSIRGFAAQAMPAVYYENLNKYLDAAYAKAGKDFLSQSQSHTGNDASLIQALREMVEIDQTHRLLK